MAPCTMAIFTQETQTRTSSTWPSAFLAFRLLRRHQPRSRQNEHPARPTTTSLVRRRRRRASQPTGRHRRLRWSAVSPPSPVRRRVNFSISTCKTVSHSTARRLTPRQRLRAEQDGSHGHGSPRPANGHSCGVKSRCPNPRAERDQTQTSGTSST